MRAQHRSRLAATAATLALAVSALGLPSAAGAAALAPHDVEVRDISSNAGTLNMTDIQIERDYSTDGVEGSGSTKRYPFAIRNNGPHSSAVAVEATCGFTNSTSGGAAGVTVQKSEIFVVNRRTRHVVIECSGPGDAAGVVVKVRPTSMLDSNNANNMAFW